MLNFLVGAAIVALLCLAAHYGVYPDAIAGALILVAFCYLLGRFVLSLFLPSR